ncbi:MAG: hypothetical protein AB7H90_14525 [Alphaproteobacteria bacterium]
MDSDGTWRIERNSAWRIERNTDTAIAESRRAGIRDSLRYHAARPREIPARLAELDREWDVDRAMTAGAAAIALAGLALTALVDHRFVAVPAMVGGFLLQHAIRGRCPPATLLRRLGFRRSDEICEERCGLKMLQGEYRSFGDAAPAQWSVTAVSIHEGVEA